MIIVIGSIRIQAGKIDEALGIAQAHVARSRTEPGCLEHGVHRAADDMHQLVFVERWQSREALQAHFALRASRLVVRSLATLATEPPSIRLYAAEPLPLEAVPPA